MSRIDQFPIQINNSYTRNKEPFNSITPERVGMYVCGPTVYGDPHLGHARSAIVFDCVFRYLQHLGYKVRYVRNITDVGHLEDEVAGQGEDKVAKKARLEQIEPMEVVQRYTNVYHEAMDALNVLRPSIEPSASGHIIEQIEVIQQILKNGFAYESDGSVYFDMTKYTESHDYGKLSGKIIEDLLSGSRTNLDGQSEKKGAHDFALWKKAKPEHIMKWQSPWSEGFPGWHLECTAMSHKYLGKTFDIHGGGMDLQFPHHEGEIAQSMGANCCKPVNYWMHNNMVTLDGQKMAKSKGNFITLEEMFAGSHELLEKAYSPMTIRFFMLQSHYSSTIDFSNTALQAAEKGYKRLMNASASLAKMEWVEGALDESQDKEINDLCDEAYRLMSDDFNTATALGVMFELASKINSFQNQQIEIGAVSTSTFENLKSTFDNFVHDVLGLHEESDGSDSVVDGLVDIFIEMRKEARAEKNWALSDQIRDKLAEKGVLLKDGKEGTTYSID